MPSQLLRRAALVVLLVAVALLARSATGGRSAGAGAATRTIVPAEYLADIPADAWLNVEGTPPTAASLKGSVVLVEFWTYLCYNCVNVEPWMKKTHADLSDRGLRVIGVHTPEFDVEKKVENVRAYTKEKSITWPVAIDNDFRVWRKYNATSAWPAFLVYDRDGRLVYRKAGERAVHGGLEAIWTALDEPATEGPTANSISRGSLPGVRAEGVRIAAETVSGGDAGEPTVRLKIEAEPGYRLVRSPPSEVVVHASDGTATTAVIGEPFEGTDGTALTAVTYWDQPAELSIIPGMGISARATEVTIHYRVCDDSRGVCSSHETTIDLRRGS